jgi:hypothetical protein
VQTRYSGAIKYKWPYELASSNVNSKRTNILWLVALTEFKKKTVYFILKQNYFMSVIFCANSSCKHCNLFSNTYIMDCCENKFLIIRILMFSKSFMLPMKEIVTWDLAVRFWYQSIDLKLLSFGSIFACFLNFVFVPNFSIFAPQRS